MSVVIVADSGSTKTIWRISRAGRCRRVVTCGLHPASLANIDIRALDVLSAERRLSGRLFFYGTGCLAETRRRKMEEWLKILFPGFSIVVDSDVNAAGMALFDAGRGVVGILGTGSAAALWDGRAVSMPVPSLGWPLGDDGGGADIARRFFRAWYAGSLSRELCSILEERSAWPTSAELVTSMTSALVPNRYLGQYTHGIAELSADYQCVQEVIADAFRDYFTYYSPLFRQAIGLPLGFVGGVADAFRPILQECAAEVGFSVSSVLATPVDVLAQRHFATTTYVEGDL